MGQTDTRNKNEKKCNKIFVVGRNNFIFNKINEKTEQQKRTKSEWKCLQKELFVGNCETFFDV